MPQSIPQPAEVWRHQHRGLVLIIRRHNERECVCETADRRALLSDELLLDRVATGQFQRDAKGKITSWEQT